VEVTINNYPLFLQVNGVNFISEDFFVRFDTASAVSCPSLLHKINGSYPETLVVRLAW
jgi:hypothetical protein